MPSKVFWYLLVFQFFIYLSLARSDETAQDCVDLLDKGFRQDGVYFIDPDNQGPFQVFCDQTTNGGGWIVLQKRFDGSEDFYRNWSDYKNGFGRLNGEFWLGNDKIHRLTNRHQELLVELEDFRNISAHAQYDYFSVDSEEDWYELHVGTYSGSAGNSLIYHNNMKFSTKDIDNDLSMANCSHKKLGAWWYKDCADANLNGYYTMNWAAIDSNIHWDSFKKRYPMKSTSMKARTTTAAEWDYSIELTTNGNLAHAQISKLTKLDKLTVCWWMKLLTTDLAWPFTVFSIDEPSLKNSSFAFSIQGHSEFRLTVNATDHNYFIPELNISDNRWYYMCVRGPYNGFWIYSVGLWKIKFAVRPEGLDIQSGSILRIGIFSENWIVGEKETVIAHLSQLNIWDVTKDFTFLQKTSRSCSGPMGTVILWSVVQFGLHDSVSKNSPAGCTSADNIHWSLSTADKDIIVDDSSLWQGNVVGDGVDLDTNVISLQGGGHVILGSFPDRCPGIPSLCEDGFTVSFWMKHGVKFTSYILGQNEKYHEALESMVSGVTPTNGKWTRCYHARSDGFTAHAFHSRCDNKGPTITLVKVKEFIFGGFLDQNWGGPNTRYISSSLAFLFSINNVLGLEPFKIDVKESNKTSAALNDPSKGPVFGLNDLTIAFNGKSIPRESESHIGNAYNRPDRYEDQNKVYGFGLLAETRVFTWDDFEVFNYDAPHQALGVADPAVVPDSAFDSSSERVSQKYIANKSLLFTEGEWCAHEHYCDKQQWLQANIGYNDQAFRKIAVMMSKPPKEASWVISYLLNKSTDGINWTSLDTPLGQFEGVYLADRNYVFDSRLAYLRFLPQTWNSDICMKIRITSTNQEISLDMTASSERCMAPPHFARLNLPGLCLSAWCSKPRSEDPHPWLRVSLGTPQYILFVATQGTENNKNKYFVLSYYLSYADVDDRKWKNYTENGKLKIFEGNWDASTVVKNAILRPFKTRTLKFHIDRCWSEQCCMRVEVYGPECQIGISDWEISASSEWDLISDAINNFLVATPGRNQGVWTSAILDAKQWLQVDLGIHSSSTITRVATQGRDDIVLGSWVTRYKLQYSDDEINFQYYRELRQTTAKIFAGNTDYNSVVSHDLNASITARYIRFRPIKWHIWISMRVELYGCRRVCNAKALGMESGAILDSQISASTEYSHVYLASYGRLNYKDRWAWSSRTNDPDQWLQVDVNSQHISVVRIATQGNLPYLEHEYVTTYQLQYGNDGQVFYYYREQGQSADKIFAGNIDALTAVSHDLNPPITARFIRFRPVSWVAHISMRVELYTCQSAFGCSPAALGMESGGISDSQISASSEYLDNVVANFGRLNFQDEGGGWAALIPDANQWLQIDLNNEHTRVMRVATQGRTAQHNHYQCVRSYKLQYSNDKVSFRYYREQGQTTDKIFVGNTDADTVVSHDLNPPITARYIRFRPIAWHAWVSMRVELYGFMLENAPHQKDPGTIVSWRSKNTNIEDKMEFEYKQVNELFTSYHQLEVTSGDKVYKLNIVTIPKKWHHVAFTWSKAWGLKFYQNGVLVAENGRAKMIVTSATNPTDGLFVTGNRLLSNDMKSANNFQLHDLTVWPRIVSQAQIREEVETVACRLTDWCLKQSSYDDFDWSFGESCTETKETGPCADANFNYDVRRSFSNAAFKGKTHQNPSICKPSSLAVDGDLNTRSELGPDSNPWWTVDLGRDGLVTGVRLALNVTSHRGGPGIVIIKVVNETGDSGECATIDENFINETLVNHVMTSCDVPLLGRYVQVEMTVINKSSIGNCQFSMFLYEVDVMLEQTAGFYYLEASPPRVKGDKARLITQYILPRFNCLTFSYHMEGAYVGKLSVYLKSYKSDSEIILWRLFREQSHVWRRGEIPIQSKETFMIIFEGIVDNGEEGDLAVDEVAFTRNQNCSFIPNFARSTYAEAADFRSDIIGHIPAYKAHLESWLIQVGFQGKLWKPCYSSATDGWDSGIFHKNCDEKGATLTVGRFNNTIFGGFADHSWGRLPEGFRVSTKSFLFGFEKTTGQKPKELVLGLDQVSKVIRWSKDRGPIFGNDELVFSSDMTQAHTSELTTYIDASPKTNKSILLRGESVYLHAIEVLTIGDSLCGRQCPLYQYCDEVRGWCSWDMAFKDARFCDNSNFSSYWPLDSHLNMVNLRGDVWGTFVGAVGTSRGPRLGAVYTSGDAAVIELGEVNGICFTDPMSCRSGFTVSLWLKRKTLYSNNVTQRQVILSIGDRFNDLVTFKLLQKSGKTEEHLAVRVLASSRKCVRIFSVPRNMWSQFIFVWNATDVDIFRNGVKVDQYLDGGYCTNQTVEEVFQSEQVVTLRGDAEFDDLQIWNRALAPSEISEMFTCIRAPSWTCAISDWTKSLKTEGWSRCSGDYSLMNGLRRGENGGLEDFVDQLEGAWCCSPPSQYRHIGLKCVTNRYIENWYGNHGYLHCWDGKFIRGIYRAASSQAFFDTLKNVECCKPTSHPSSYGGCYTINVPSFDTPGLAKCDDHYFITQIRVSHCRQLYCVDRLRCCKMETDERDDQELDIRLEAKLLDEVWNPNLADSLHYQFQSLRNNIESKIWDVYQVAKKARYVNAIVTHKFRPGSVIAFFSVILEFPYYEIITPLIEDINQTTAPNQRNFLGNMAVKLLAVEAINVYGRSLNLAVTANSSAFHLSWESAEDNPKFGFFQGYQVLYSKSNDITEDFLLAMEINDNITQAWFVGEACEFYSFKVRAYSLEGYGKPSEVVNAATPCPVVSNVSAVGKTSSSISLQWVPVKGSLVTGYIVTYYTVSGGPTRNVTLQRSASRVDLVNLRGMTAYSIKVGLLASHNEIFWSEEILCSTPPGAPNAPPENVTAYNLTSTSVNVTWFPVPSHSLNGILQSYRVFYRKASVPHSPSMEIVVGNTTLSVVISALKKFTVYSVWVKAVTTAAGPSSTTLYVSTDEDVPSFPPTILYAFNVSSTIIRVIWQPIPADHIHGVLLGYHVEYHKTDREKRSVTMVTVNASSLSVDIVGLVKFSEYKIMVSGFTRKGDGSQSEITSWTDEDVPDGPPTDISAHSDNSTVLEVQWSPVLQESQNGVILGYHILLSDAWGVSLRNATFQNSRQTYYHFQDLEAWTNYSVKVGAFTSKGNGPYSTSLFANTEEDAPLVAPTNVTGHNTSSTSIFVTWQPVSPNSIHIRGIHRGYSIYYISRDTPRPSILMNVTVDVLTTHVQLTNLYKFTKYDINVTARTRWDGPKSATITVSTDEGTPDLPPSGITATTLGQTGITIRWHPVPLGYRGGIITGYRITYNSSNSTSRGRNVSGDASYVTLTSLAKFTFYDVYIQARTMKGSGPAHYLKTATDMGVPNEAPPGLTAENWDTTHSIVVKWQPLPPSNEYGILAGYRVRYSLTAIGEESVTDYSEKELDTSPETNQVLLENLVMYGTYSVWVSAFTIKGDGPASFTYAETCRCDKHLRTNWRSLAPYVGNKSSVDAPYPSGILPGIIHDMAVTCCQTCASHGQSLVDFSLDGNGEASEKPTDSDLREKISHQTQFSFPVPGFSEQEKYGVDFGYWPLVQTPGVAYVVNTDVGTSPSDALNNTLTSCLPAVLLVFVMSLLAGFVMWILECGDNQSQFSRSITRGPWEGFWWAFVTMTTVGYGDKFAASLMARVLTVIWMLAGLIIQGLFVATVTMSLVSQSLDVDFKLYGNKIAAIQDSFEYRFGLRRNAQLNPKKLYSSYDEISAALVNGEVSGALIDTYVLGSRKDLFEKPSLRLMKIYDYSTAYGVVLGGEARKLKQCFRKYVQSHKEKIFQTIEEQVEFVEESRIPLAVERSAGLFDSESTLFKTYVLLLSSLLLVFLAAGSVWELSKRVKRRQKVETEKGRLKLLRDNTRNEVQRSMEDFTVGIKIFAEELKTKQSKERSRLLKKLKSSSLKGMKYSTTRLSMEAVLTEVDC